MSKPDADAKPVGYCSPPVETRFRKGISGNPRGRPRNSIRKAGQPDELSELLHGANKVFVAGRKVSIRRIDLLLQTQKKKALSGDYRAAENLLRSYRDLQQREQRAEHSAGRWPILSSVLVVPPNPHETVDWFDLYGHIKRDGLVPANRQQTWWVTPSWLKSELKAQGKGEIRKKDKPMDSAIARLFDSRVSALKAGIQVKVPLSSALYNVLIEAAQSKTAAMSAIRKMDAEIHSEADGDTKEAEREGGVLIVPYAPDSIEEWTRLYGELAKGGGGAARERVSS